MINKTVNTYWARIYISGPIDIIKQTCREECFKKGLCVTVDPTTFIYTGGEENGAVIGLINYPRFPDTPDNIFDRAKDLAWKILQKTCQQRVLIMSPDKTELISLKATI